MSQTKEGRDNAPQTNKEESTTSATSVSSSTKNNAELSTTENAQTQAQGAYDSEAGSSNRASSSLADSSSVARAAAAVKGGACDNDRPDPTAWAAGVSNEGGQQGSHQATSKGVINDASYMDSKPEGDIDIAFRPFFKPEDFTHSGTLKKLWDENLSSWYEYTEDMQKSDSQALRDWAAKRKDKSKSNENCNNKEEAISWADGMIDRLNEEIAVKEIEVEQLTEGMRNKTQQGEYVVQVKGHITMHRFHIDHLELIVKRLRDGQLEANKMGGIRTSLDHYLNAYEDGGYLAACQKGFYDSLHLDDNYFDYAGGTSSTATIAQKTVFKPLQSETSHGHKETVYWPYVGAPLSKLLFSEFICDLRDDAQKIKDNLADIERQHPEEYNPLQETSENEIGEAEETIKHFEKEIERGNDTTFLNTVHEYITEKGYDRVKMLFENFCLKRNIQKKLEDDGASLGNILYCAQRISATHNDGKDFGLQDQHEDKDGTVSFLCDMMDKMQNLIKLDTNAIEQREIIDPISIAECKQRIANHELHTTNLGQLMNYILDDQLMPADVSQSFRSDLNTYIADYHAAQTFEETKTPDTETISEMYVQHGFAWLASNSASRETVASAAAKSTAPEAANGGKKRNHKEAATTEDEDTAEYGKKLRESTNV